MGNKKPKMSYLDYMLSYIDNSKESRNCETSYQGISVLYCFVMNHPKLSDLKEQPFYSMQFFVSAVCIELAGDSRAGAA